MHYNSTWEFRGHDERCLDPITRKSADANATTLTDAVIVLLAKKFHCVGAIGWFELDYFTGTVS